LTLRIDRVDDFAQRCPVQFRTLVHATTFINYGRIELGERPILALSYFARTA
jgi:hypothetical protein